MNAVALHSIAVILALCPTFCGAQSYYAPRIDSLSEKDVLDAFAIGNVVFFYRYSQLPSNDKAVSDLSKVISVHRAKLHGRPDRDVCSLVDRMLGHPHQLTVKKLSAIDHGDSGFVWKITWEIQPKHGGSSGIPFEFRSYVNPDGSVMMPERFLCDHVPVPGTDQNIFSILSFSDFQTDEENGEKVHGDRVLSLATNSVRSLEMEKPLMEQKVGFRFRGQSVMQLPVGMKHDGKPIIRRVWAVTFVDAKSTGNAIHEAEPLTVWVTEDGIVSQLTFGKWQARSRRTKR